MPANENPLILSIETATRAGGVAVMRGETLLAAQTGVASVSHSADLLHHVGNALEEANVTLHDMDIFAAATGPGSFTGLRIGLATVKSFAATLARQCVGIPTLYAVAHSAGKSNSTLALLPAGRGEVFAQLLAVDSKEEVQPLNAPAHLSPRKLLERVKGEPKLKWAGEGAQIHAEVIKSQALAEGIMFQDEAQSGRHNQGNEPLWTFASPTLNLAVDVARLALMRFRAGDSVHPEQLHAIYVRPSDAELINNV